MTELSEPKPIQNQSKTNPKAFQKQLKNNNKMSLKLHSLNYHLIHFPIYFWGLIKSAFKYFVKMCNVLKSAV